MINREQQSYINELAETTKALGKPWDLKPDFPAVRNQIIKIQKNFTVDQNQVIEKNSVFNNTWVKTYFPLLQSNSEVEIFYIHGGGWTINSIHTHELLHRYYCSQFGMTLHAMEYPKAPEHPYPAAIDSLVQYLLHLHTTTGKRFVLIGDSAGGNLAVAMQLKLTQMNYPDIVTAIISNYGVFDCNYESDSYKKYGQDPQFLMLKDAMIDFFKWYTGHSKITDPLVCPVNADLSEMPPVYLSVGEFEILLDENIDLFNRLPKNNLNTLKIEKSLVHGYMRLPHMVQQVRDIYQDQHTWIQKVLESALLTEQDPN